MKNKIIAAFLVILTILTTGCGQNSGLAPSNFNNDQIVTPAESTSVQLKNGESVSLPNGWEIAIDTTDAVEEVILANGWSAEVIFEL